MTLPHHDARENRDSVRPHHIFLPSVPTPHIPVPGHVNHIPQATIPDTERTFQVDIDGDGLIPAPH